MKVPKPRKLPSGNWFIQMRLGGESVPITEPTEKRCVKSAQLVKAEYLAGKREKKKSGGPTLREAIDNYIAARDNTLSPSTIRGYKIIQRTRFHSVMDRQITEITDWQAICNNEAKLCSAKTLKNAWMFIASAIKKETGVSVTGVTLPQVVIREKQFLEPDQIPVFIKALRGQECEIPALLALHSLRRSEICALTWDNIDLNNGRILVDGALVYDSDNALIGKETTKNATSRRYVPIMIPELTAALKQRKEKEGMVVAQTPNVICKKINQVCKNIGLPQIGVHGLRHSFASLAYHLNVPEKITMQIGGWANYETMRKIYTHLAQKDVAKYEKSISDFFNSANKNANAR